MKIFFWEKDLGIIYVWEDIIIFCNIGCEFVIVIEIFYENFFEYIVFKIVGFLIG